MNLNESKLCVPVAAWLREGGFDVWAEVPTPRGFSSCDLVGRMGDSLLRMVELKTSWSRKLLHQCYLHQLGTDDVWAACGAKPRPATVAAFQARGVGMIRVVGCEVEVLVVPDPRRHVVKWYADKIHAHLNRMTKSDDGGKPCLAGEGPAQDCQKAIVAYRAVHPKATWDELYANVPNHYVSAKSMYGAMRMLKQRLAFRAIRAAYRSGRQNEATNG